MADSALATLAQAIGYPEEIPPDAVSYSFVVDDGRVEASEENGRLVLVRELAPSGDVELAEFARYAAGRALKEEAVLAYDPAGDRLILWQELPARAEPDLLRRFFEVFLTSCDWWLARVDGAENASSIPEMMIRP